MISSAFKGAYQNQVNQQTQGINTITGGIKDAGTAVLGILGFSGALGNGVIAEAGKNALANRIGGVGGNIMLATLEEKKQTALQAKGLGVEESVRQQMIADRKTEANGISKTDLAFDQVAGELSTDEEFATLDTVWNKLQQDRKRAQEKEMAERVNKAYEKVGENWEDNYKMTSPLEALGDPGAVGNKEDKK